jgi:ketosteroid isomerase-like protein
MPFSPGRAGDRPEETVSSATNKQLVLTWFAAGPHGDPAALTDDFVWHTPRGPAGLLNDGIADFGHDAFVQLGAIQRAAYRGDPEFELTFCIAEDDWVVMQGDVTSTSHDGDVYTNVYVFTIRCEDDRIAELWEHADTKLWWDTIAGTDARAEQVAQRLAAERKGLGR